MKKSAYIFGTVLVFLPLSPASAASCLESLSGDSGATALLSCLKEMQSKIDQLEARPIALTNQQVSEIAQTVVDEEPSAPAFSESIPSGAVVASTITCDNFGDGWRPYYPAAGRFMIGAGPHSIDESKHNSDINDDDLKIYEGPGDLSWETLRHPAASNLSHQTRVGGVEIYSLQEDEMPAHRHEVVWINSRGNQSVSLNESSVAVENDDQFHIASTREGGQANRNIGTKVVGAGAPHSNMPPFIALYFCLKE